MNKNIDLTKILKDCPEGFKLYTTLLGYVEFGGIRNDDETFPIRVKEGNIRFKVRIVDFTKEGYYFKGKGECLLFQSAEKRDWSKFTAPWYKKERFNPNTLKPYDKVLVRASRDKRWMCALFSYVRKEDGNITFKYQTTGGAYVYCIPYNDDTKHLVGTTDEAPEYYRYWED